MKKILNVTMVLLGSATLSPDLYAATEPTPSTPPSQVDGKTPDAVTLNNADGTRPRISFKPISSAFEGDYTLVQIDEKNKQIPILKLTIKNQEITKIETLSDVETDEGINVVGGIWRLNRDQQNSANPKGTLIKPGKLSFILMVNEKFGRPLSLGKEAWFHQQTLEGKTQKLEALNFNLNNEFISVKYAPMGEVAPASTTAFSFDRKAYGFLDNAPLLKKTAQAIEGYQSFLSRRNMYTPNDADSITFSAKPDARKMFLFGLAKAYLQNLFKEPSPQPWADRFKTMPGAELKKLSGSLVSWFQEATISEQRILTEIEKNTFFETIFSALKTLQAEMAQIDPKPAVIETPASAPQTQPPAKPTNKIQELMKKFEGKK